MNNINSNLDGQINKNTTQEQTIEEEDEPDDKRGRPAKVSPEFYMLENLHKHSIAAEIKDNIGQLILLARINLDLLSGERTSEGYQSTLDTMRDLLDQALDEIRTISSQFSPPLLAEIGLESTLEHLCLQMGHFNGLQVKFVDDGNEKSFEDLTRSIVIYHVAREILFNLARHVKYRALQLSIERCGNCLKLMIEDLNANDDFSGIIEDHRKMGRLNICQAIQQIGGEIVFTSASTGNTAITIRVPFTAA